MKNNAIKTFFVCLITLSSLKGIAQTPGVDNSTGNLESTAADQAAAPINDYFLPMLLLGVVLGYRLLRNKKQLAK